MGQSKHDHSTLKFPEGFLWGAGSSAFQVEGNIKDSDWWEWEQTHQPEEFRSGQAADHYNRFEEDFKLAQSLGHNAHRLSLEWSRIEPREGEFDDNEIEHYKTVLKSLKDKGFTVMLTLHHFTNPAWFAHLGGWSSGKSVYYFERFVKRVVPELKDYVDLWITINEPWIYATHAYVIGHFPPQKKSYWLATKCFFNMAQAHKKVYRFLHVVDPHVKVGFANPVESFETFHAHSLQENLAKWVLDNIRNHSFNWFTQKTHDFLALNYYKHQRISINGHWQLPSLVEAVKTGKDVTDLGWEIHPEGIFDVLIDFSSYKLPIYITENGIASKNDDRRVRFLLSYLKEVYHASQSGTKIKGYFYWSLLDNMELNNGFDPKFGLIEVNFETQKRTPKPSSFVYKEIIKNNGIPHYLLKLLGHGIQVEEVVKSK
ncbi:MAG: glycoside hydrolase family 1 protein [Candidatus Daviesbacteria bacterium]|nr:glycoside hydrolase family 1 protein [Candidatus Daviesbacteria bacterium]